MWELLAVLAMEKDRGPWEGRWSMLEAAMLKSEITPGRNGRRWKSKDYILSRAGSLLQEQQITGGQRRA